MSTDDLDARLQQAGERWREANTAIATVDLAAATATDRGHEAPTEVPLVRATPQKPRRRKRIWIAAAAGVAAATVAAFLVVHLADNPGGSAPPAVYGGTNALIGVDWTLTAMAKADGTPAPVIAPASLKFDGKTVSGTDACNYLSSTARVTAKDVQVGEVAGTAMGCIDRAAGFGAEVDLIHEVLSGTVAWSVTGDELRLTKDGAGTLTYRAKAKPVTTTDPKALAGTSWGLSTIQHDGLAETPAGGASLVFDALGQGVRSGQCDNATAEVHAGRIVFGSQWIVNLTSSCEHLDPGERALVYGKILVGTVTWSVTDDQLTITKNGAGSLVYQAAIHAGAPSATRTK